MTSSPIYTTLNRIRAHSPCASGWENLLRHLGKTKGDDEPLAFSTILDSSGLDDALWCCLAEPKHDSLWRHYAVDCAERVAHLLTDERSKNALAVARRYALGLASDDELDSARVAQHPIINATAVYSVISATYRPASRAAWFPPFRVSMYDKYSAEHEWQTARLRELVTVGVWTPVGVEHAA